MDRRQFLRLTAAPAMFPISRAAWAVTAAAAPQRLIVVFLRGAVDGLNLVVPYGDRDYYALRTTIAIAPPGKAGGVLPLDEHFGLHPALAALQPLWVDKSLAFVHAAGSPDPTRSHFDAQLFIENGTPGRKTTADGWMNRLLACLPGPHGPTDAVSVGVTLPQILRGKMAVANLPLGPKAADSLPIDRAELGREFDRLYAGDDALATAYREARAARGELLADLVDETKDADGGAPPPAGFPAQAARLAGMMARDPKIRLAFANLGGWDTHVDQGGEQGRLANRLRPLGEGLAVLAKGLGAAWQDTIVVVLSEFGRTAHENGDGGTDHGHGNVMIVAGGAVRGGRVYGDWPGLTRARLYQGRDLAVTTDFRLVLAAVLERHFRLGDRELAQIFPGIPPSRAGLGNMLTA